jgi:hypothetical protein
MDRRLELMEALIRIEARKARALKIAQALSDKECAIKEELGILIPGISKRGKAVNAVQMVKMNQQEMENTVISMLSAAPHRTLHAGELARALGLDKAGFQRFRKAFFVKADIQQIGGGRGVCYRLA